MTHILKSTILQWTAVYCSEFIRHGKLVATSLFLLLASHLSLSVFSCATLCLWPLTGCTSHFLKYWIWDCFFSQKRFGYLKSTLLWSGENMMQWAKETWSFCLFFSFVHKIKETQDWKHLLCYFRSNIMKMQTKIPFLQALTGFHWMISSKDCKSMHKCLWQLWTSTF